jgi:hypothetical protein
MATPSIDWADPAVFRGLIEALQNEMVFLRQERRSNQEDVDAARARITQGLADLVVMAQAEHESLPRGR